MKAIILLSFLVTLDLACSATLRRCANLFDESCANGGLIGANQDDDYLNNNAVGKRCANLFDESCINGGLLEAGQDDRFLASNGVGRRGLMDYFPRLGRRDGDRDMMLKSLAEFFRRARSAKGKRCANLFDESCVNGGLPGANEDDDWLSGGSPGKR